MGRLTKSKIDQIVKLRGQDYTQKETAERVNVHLRTVRKYDPLRQSRSSEQHSVEDRLRTLEEALRASWDWNHLLYDAMIRSPVLRKDLWEKTYECPRCDGKLKYNDDEALYVCRDCGHKLYQSLNWCYHCISQQDNYIEQTDKWICPKCKTGRFTS
jgi:hypothetical protein